MSDELGYALTCAERERDRLAGVVVRLEAELADAKRVAVGTAATLARLASAEAMAEACGRLIATARMMVDGSGLANDLDLLRSLILYDQAAREAKR